MTTATEALAPMTYDPTNAECEAAALILQQDARRIAAKAAFRDAMEEARTYERAYAGPECPTFRSTVRGGY